MAGNIFAKETTVVVLQNDNGASIASTSASASSATALDMRTNGNGSECFWGNFELKAGASVSTSVASKTVDLYLVPATDGTNYEDVDTVTPFFPPNTYRGSFVMITSATTVRRMVIEGVPLQPMIYNAYLVNNLGQTISANWGLRVMVSEVQYT